ncbi:MAG TPA: 50S ribosomal protein L23 [Rhabdochlamydiaceae bacterium]|nr:50S ribosomal protein L23 [Rhabdochlamydiaceae bacterium]
MLKRNPYNVIKSRYVTEKARVLEGLQNNNSNASVKKCATPKYVFLVDKNATKPEIASAVEAIYADKNIKVIGVNTITNKPKARTVRGRKGMKPGFKKAIVTLKAGGVIEDKI